VEEEEAEKGNREEEEELLTTVGVDDTEGLGLVDENEG
jgi:hypothetical protein